MFTKTGEVKKFMKDALKRTGLRVGNTGKSLVVWCETWGISVEYLTASNKFKAAIMELIGDIPEAGEYYNYMLHDGEVVMESAIDIPQPYENWKLALDYAVCTPIRIVDFYSNFCIFQRNKDKEFMAANEKFILAISPSELEHGESLPKRPSVLNGCVLYYKNDYMIYWFGGIVEPEKVEGILYPNLKNINFLSDDWMYPTEEPDKPEIDGGQESLPY